MSVYNTEPVKNNTGGDKGKRQSSTQPPTPSQSETTISFSTTSDFYYENRGKLFDADKGKFKTVGDFHKQMIGGVAGVVYNTLLLVSVEGKAAQIALNAGRIATSTTSLSLGSDMNVASALGVSTVATLFKPSFASYEFTKPVLNKVATNAAASKNVLTRFAGGAVNQWSKAGHLVHEFYHKLPAVHLGKAVHGHYPVSLTVIPLPWVEASLAKTGAKYTVPGGKKNYSPYYTGQGALNQLYLSNNSYNTGTDPYAESFKNMANTRNFAIPVDNVSNRQLIDSVDPHKPLISPTHPPKDNHKSEKEKLEGFIAEFDAKKSKDIWIERLDRIFRPQLYTSYDKAKRELYAMKAGVNTVATKIIMFLVDDIVKSIANIGKGYSNAQKLDSGIDYNETVIQQLAAYKTDLEAAGGKFIIESNGNFKIVRPPKTEVKVGKLTNDELKTMVIKGPLSGPDSGTLLTDARNKFNKKMAVQRNVPAIRELVKGANKSKQDLDFRKFINKEYNVNVMDKRLGSNLENIQTLTGKSKTEVVNAFYTSYPKYAPAEFNRQRGITSGNVARSKIFSNPRYKDF